MSRIGRKPVAIPSGVTVEVRPSTGSGQEATVVVKGPKGELSYTHLPEVRVRVDGNQVFVERGDDSDASKARHGLTRALIANMVQGASQGYEKRLEIIGVGYKASLKAKVLQLHIGYSHPIDLPIPAGIEVAQDEKNKNILNIRGNSKQLVGQVAASIRALRPPEPYKGKGIRYIDEVVRRKVGKAAVTKTA